MRPSLASSRDSAAPHIKLEDQHEGKKGNDMYAIIAGIFAALGGLFFGFDQGVTGGIIVMDSFLKSFCIGYHGTEEQCKASDIPTAFNTFITFFQCLLLS